MGHRSRREQRGPSEESVLQSMLSEYNFLIYREGICNLGAKV